MRENFSFSFFLIFFPSYHIGSTSRRLRQQRLQTSMARFLQGLARSQCLRHLPFPRLPPLQISGQKLFQIGSMEGFDTMRHVHSCYGNKKRYPPHNMLHQCCPNKILISSPVQNLLEQHLVSVLLWLGVFLTDDLLLLLVKLFRFSEHPLVPVATGHHKRFPSLVHTSPDLGLCVALVGWWMEVDREAGLECQFRFLCQAFHFSFRLRVVLFGAGVRWPWCFFRSDHLWFAFV